MEYPPRGGLFTDRTVGVDTCPMPEPSQQAERKEEKRCPICGKGVLQHLGPEAPKDMQTSDSEILETYTCGHEVTGPSLATADAEVLEVERRETEETVEEPRRLDGGKGRG
jgi:hypothetical protein